MSDSREPGLFHASQKFLCGRHGREAVICDKICNTGVSHRHSNIKRFAPMADPGDYLRITRNEDDDDVEIVAKIPIAEYTRRRIDIECISQGMLAAENVISPYGTPIVRKERPIQHKHIAQMRQAGITQIEALYPPADATKQRLHIDDFPDHTERLKMERVMVVDDSKSVRMVLGGIFRAAGLNVAGTAEDAEQAIRMAGELKPTLVTMDLSMPGLDGAKAIPHVLTRSPGCIVVVVSALGYSDRISESLEAGAVKFFTKPLDYEELKRQCIELLIKKHLSA